ncbi:unnamed protein product [Dovyalis caffra]|uniref:Uncharacterized protein n=1 Tax=Dovyalis caffra TaxID=77055 RepID=A0AAV1S8N7_9ROSI|nr:unnamed protein product [Dovyalis caffra]
MLLEAMKVVFGNGERGLRSGAVVVFQFFWVIFSAEKGRGETVVGRLVCSSWREGLIGTKLCVEMTIYPPRPSKDDFKRPNLFKAASASHRRLDPRTL